MGNLDPKMLEEIVRSVIAEKLAGCAPVDFVRHQDKSGVTSVKLPTVRLNESNRLDTGNKADQVYTKDLFTLEESPRLGCGMMEMTKTTFDWTLNYDEVDYVIDGHLEVVIDGRVVSADPGEIIFIPKGTSIQFSAPTFARFLYVTYPADWATQ